MENETKPVIKPATPFIGDRSSYDFVDPEDVLGGEHKTVPSEWRAFIKKFRAPAGAENIEVSVYRIIRTPGMLKVRHSFLEKLPGEEPPDEEFLKSRYGGGEYVLRMEFVEGGQKKGVLTAPMVIDDWRPDGQVPVVTPALPAPAVPGLDSEERMWDRMERIIGLMRGANPPPAAPSPSASAIVEEAQKTANRILEDASKQVGRMHAEMRAMTLAAVHDDEDEEELPVPPAPTPAPLDLLSLLPEYIRPYFPMIEAGFKKLITGTPADASMVKGMITTTEEFQKVLGDQESVLALTKALVLKHGEEKVERAWALLNEPETPAKTFAGRAKQAAARTAGKAAGKVAAAKSKAKQKSR